MYQEFWLRSRDDKRNTVNSRGQCTISLLHAFSFINSLDGLRNIPVNEIIIAIKLMYRVNQYISQKKLYKNFLMIRSL